MAPRVQSPPDTRAGGVVQHPRQGAGMRIHKGQRLLPHRAAAGQGSHNGEHQAQQRREQLMQPLAQRGSACGAGATRRAGMARKARGQAAGRGPATTAAGSCTRAGACWGCRVCKLNSLLHSSEVGFRPAPLPTCVLPKPWLFRLQIHRAALAELGQRVQAKQALRRGRARRRRPRQRQPQQQRQLRLRHQQ